MISNNNELNLDIIESENSRLEFLCENNQKSQILKNLAIKKLRVNISIEFCKELEKCNSIQKLTEKLISIGITRK